MRTPASKIQDERWLPVVGYEGSYEVSDHGRVRSVARRISFDGRYGPVTKTVRERFLALTVDRGEFAYGRLQVKLCVGAVRKTRLAHHLVAEAFIGPRPEGHDVAHHDGDASNNHLNNLRYATPRENSADKVAHGTSVSTPSRLSHDVVLKIRQARPGLTYQAIADRFHISIAHAYRVANGQRCGAVL